MTDQEFLEQVDKVKVCAFITDLIDRIREQERQLELTRDGGERDSLENVPSD